MDVQSRPKLARGCRLTDSGSQHPALLVPEGIVKLNPSGFKILELCDGIRTVRQIGELLQPEHPSAPIEEIEQDIHAFLDALRGKGLVEVGS